MFQSVSIMWMNTLAQHMLLHSAKLDQKSDLPSYASQANVASRAMCTYLTHNSYTKRCHTIVSIMLLITVNTMGKHRLCLYNKTITTQHIRNSCVSLSSANVRKMSSYVSNKNGSQYTLPSSNEPVQHMSKMLIGLFSYFPA